MCRLEAAQPGSDKGSGGDWKAYECGEGLQDPRGWSGGSGWGAGPAESGDDMTGTRLSSVQGPNRNQAHTGEQEVP